MRYFVTGATGFIGGYLVRALLQRGDQVVTLARSPEKAGDLKALGVEIFKGDITERETLRAPMQGVDGVFHVAAWYKVGARDKSVAYNINVNGTRSVLEMMRELKIAKGVYTSTLAVFGNTNGRLPDESEPQPAQYETEYDRTKGLAHYDVALPMMRERLPLVVVQPGVVYGIGDTSSIRQTFIQYLQGKLPIAPEIATFAWAHVEDVVQGHLLAMDKGRVGECYIICGEVRRLKDTLDLAQRITGVAPPALRVSRGMANFMTGMTSLIERVMPLPELYASETMRSLNATYIGSNEKARRELGYNPRSLEEGLPEVLRHEMRLLGMKPPAG